MGLCGLCTTNVAVNSGVLRGVVGHGDEIVLDRDCQRGDLIQLVQAAGTEPSDAHDHHATHGESARSENNFSRTSGFGVRGRILSSTRGDGRWQSFSVYGGSPYRCASLCCIDKFVVGVVKGSRKSVCGAAPTFRTVVCSCSVGCSDVVRSSFRTLRCFRCFMCLVSRGLQFTQGSRVPEHVTESSSSSFVRKVAKMFIAAVKKIVLGVGVRRQYTCFLMAGQFQRYSRLYWGQIPVPWLQGHVGHETSLYQTLFTPEGVSCGCWRSAVTPVCLGSDSFEPTFVMHEHELSLPCRDVHGLKP